MRTWLTWILVGGILLLGVGPAVYVLARGYGAPMPCFRVEPGAVSSRRAFIPC
jgi:hypothetical protein